MLGPIPCAAGACITSKKRLQKRSPKKDDFSLKSSPPLEAQWDPKILQIRPRRPPKRRRGRRSEKVYKKTSNLTLSTCLNPVRGIENQGCHVFGKDPKWTSKGLPFGGLLGYKIIQESFRKGTKNTCKKKSSKSPCAAPKRYPNVG